jgi:hypothetical protein
MTRYVTLAYGEGSAIYRQSLMLLVSLFAFASDNSEIVVVTDHPERFVWFGTRIEIEYLDADRLAQWRGPNPFSMRHKLELARASIVSGRQEVVLLDADVLARRPLDPFVERLRAGDLFMHKREYVLSETRRVGNKKLWRELKKRGFRDDDGMWNSGVLAIPSGDCELLDASLKMYDELGADGVRHFATEQLVEGIVLGRTGRLKPAEDWFLHYWGNKSGYDAELSRFLADAFIDGLSVKEAAARYRASPIDLPPEVRPTPFQKLLKKIGVRPTTPL